MIELLNLIVPVLIALIGSGLLVVLVERKRKNRSAAVDDTVKLTEIALKMLLPLQLEIDALKRDIKMLKEQLIEHQITITQQLARVVKLQAVLADQSTTIRGMQALLTVKEQQLEERDRVLVHQQGEIDLLTAKIAILEKTQRVQTGTLREMRENGK
jgi:chromosome segregation ATPase